MTSQNFWPFLPLLLCQTELDLKENDITVVRTPPHYPYFFFAAVFKTIKKTLYVIVRINMQLLTRTHNQKVAHIRQTKLYNDVDLNAR